MIDIFQNKPRYLFRIMLVGLFILFFVSFLKLKLWDYDFWWHISTGKYIVHNVEVPKEDVFSYSTIENRDPNSETATREAHLMGQYWLAQIILYYIYHLWGSWGVAAARSLLLTATLAMVYLGLRRNKVPPLLSLAFVIPGFSVLLNMATGERPVLFTFLLAVLVFLFIDDFLKTKGKSLYAVPALMLLWANLHGGFVLGLVIIAAFLFSELLAYARNKSSLSRNELILFASFMTVSALITLLNPTGWLVFSMFQSKYSFFSEGVNEYRPFAYYYRLNGSPLLPSALFIVATTAASLLLALFRMARMKLSHFIILAGIITESLLHQRYMIFTATIGVIIIGAALTDTASRLNNRYPLLGNQRLKTAGVAATALFVCLFAGRVAWAVVEDRDAFSGNHSFQAVQAPIDFIREKRIPGRMFNTDRLGGYAIWKLYPWKKVFYDTRGLNMAVKVEYNNIISANSNEVFGEPLWEKLLDMYDVNIVVSQIFASVGNTVPLVDAMDESDNWSLVYVDGMNVVYVRNISINQGLIEETGLKSEDLYWATIRTASLKALNSLNNPYLYKTIGRNFIKLEKWEEAEKAYMHALRLTPNDDGAIKALDTIKIMINRKAYSEKEAIKLKRSKPRCTLT